MKTLRQRKMEYYKYFTTKESLVAVEQNGYALRYVKEQTEAICLVAVEQNGFALQYVKEQTEAICRVAVEQNGDALRYVKEEVLIEVEEMTLTEVCTELGRTVKIVK